MRKPHRGFSFTEILFAVMILGIGFIMVAAMFPVAIRQTEANNQETITASVGRAGDSNLVQVAGGLVTVHFPGATSVIASSILLPTVPLSNMPNPLLPPTMPVNHTAQALPGQVWSFHDPRDWYTAANSNLLLLINGLTAPLPFANHNDYLWSTVVKNLIQASDPRFAWVAFYKRDFIEQGVPTAPAQNLPTPTISPAPYAQIIMVGIRSRVKQNYDPANDPLLPNSPFLPVLLTANLGAGNQAGGPTIQFSSSSGAISENAYVIVSDNGAIQQPALPTPPFPAGSFNGRIYRLGTINTAGNPPTYNFAPGEGPGSNDPALTGAQVFVVGQGLDPNNANNYGGGAQDVTAYTTFVQTP